VAVGAIAYRKLEVKRGRYTGNIMQWPCVLVVVRGPRERVLCGRKKKRYFAVAGDPSQRRARSVRLAHAIAAAVKPGAHEQQNGDGAAAALAAAPRRPFRSGASPPTSQMLSLSSSVNTRAPSADRLQAASLCCWATGPTTARARCSPSGSLAVGAVLDETQQRMACDGGGGELGLHGVIVVVLAASRTVPGMMVCTAWDTCRHGARRAMRRRPSDRPHGGGGISEMWHTMSYDGLPALVGVVLQPRLHHDEAVAISISIGGLLHKNEDSGLLHLLLLEFLSFFDCFLHAGSTGVVVCRLLVVSPWRHLWSSK